MNLFAPKLAAAAGIALALLACAGAPKPAQVAGTIQASAQVNPSTSKRPSPVLVRALQKYGATAVATQTALH